MGVASVKKREPTNTNVTYFIQEKERQGVKLVAESI